MQNRQLLLLFCSGDSNAARSKLQLPPELLPPTRLYTRGSSWSFLFPVLAIGAGAPPPYQSFIGFPRLPFQKK